MTVNMIGFSWSRIKSDVFKEENKGWLRFSFQDKTKKKKVFICEVSSLSCCFMMTSFLGERKKKVYKTKERDELMIWKGENNDVKLVDTHSPCTAVFVRTSSSLISCLSFLSFGIERWS